MKTFLLPLLLSCFAVCTPSAKAAETPVPARHVVSLAGTWQFGLVRAGSESTLPTVLPQTIHLPGTMDDAGLGTKNTTTPDLSGPYRLYDYAGPAWYRRDIEVPAIWKGKDISLFLERCRWTTTVWLDGNRISTHDSLIAPHIYDLGTTLKPGRHQLTICVDNSVKIDLGPFVSALFGGTWGNMNGIIGRIELAAKPAVGIEDVQVYPNIDAMKAHVVVKISNCTRTPGQGEVTIGNQTVIARWGADGGRAEADLDMSKAKLWDEFSPNLTSVTVRLGEDERTVRFGMRKFASKGTQFTMNDRPIFLRGTLECSVWPLTGYPPTNTPAWHRIFKIVKSYGLNFMRFHSWCPPEAAFAAADEDGVMLQVEGPQADVDIGDVARNAFIQAEMQRMLDVYGNHPSFCLMTIGNEYGGDEKILTRYVQELLNHDPRHLYSSASEATVTPNRQWTETMSGRGVQDPGTARDLREVVASDPRPIVGHEIGQWMYYPDARVEKKYTGVMRLKNFEIIYDDLKRKNQLSLAPKYIDSSGKLATLLYKEEIELLLRTRGYGGFSLLDMHDYPTQGTALVGPLDEFWDSKGFISPKEFRRYCGPVVPLLRMSKRTFTTNENFDATAQIAQFGATDLRGARPTWNIRDPQGKVVVSGTLAAGTLPTGALTDVGAVHTSLSTLKAPGKFTVTVSLAGTKYSNSWEFWVYPGNNAQLSTSQNVVICHKWDDSAKAALAAGKTVFISTIDLPKSSSRSLAGRLLPVFWSPVWFASQVPKTMGILCDPKHPALAQFPTEMNSNWQWWGLLDRSRSIVMNDAPAGFRPIVQVVDNFSRNYMLGNLFEARVGKGKLLFSAFDLSTDLKDRPAARQLLASLTHYASSAQFAPKSELTTEILDEWTSHRVNKLAALGAKVIAADSEAPGYPAINILSGDDSKFWHTPWEPQAIPMPHAATIDMGKQISFKGIALRPRGDELPGTRIADCEVYCTDDLNNWGAPVAKIRLADTLDQQTISFSKTLTARYLKLKILSGQQGAPFVSLGDLDIVLSRH